MFDKLKGSLSGAAGNGLENHLETIQALAKEHLGPKLQEIANDEEKLKDGLRKYVYPALPMPVRLVVSEEKFITFCLAHKDKILPQ